MIYLVYQTTPLFGGVRPVLAFNTEDAAKEYCDKMNSKMDGYGYSPVQMMEDTDD